jgi:adenylate cyclase
MVDNAQQRKLAIIVALDVAGYSKRTEADEIRTTGEIAALREVVERASQARGGRVFSTAGDGFMLEFGSSSAAVETALELAATCEPKVRIGVHVGDVVVQSNGDLLGHGVNVAARLMAQADPGSVLVSADVRRMIRGPLAARLVPRGKMRLAKMEETIEAFAAIGHPSDAPPAALPRAKFWQPLSSRHVWIAMIAVVALAGGGVSWWIWSAKRGTDAAAIPSTTAPVGEKSIAVLPFDARSDESKDAYFSAGIHDGVLGQLAHIGGLKVISRTSVLKYTKTNKSLRQIADELGVNVILEGAIQRSGDRVRVSAQLIDARTDAHLWAESYDEEMALTAANVFEIQSALASRIASALKGKLAPKVNERIASRPTKDLKAWELVSQARRLLEERFTAPKLEAAVALFREAIARDENYAPAWADLGQVLSEMAEWKLAPDTALAEARIAADRALTLDPSLAHGYFVRGAIALLERRRKAAQRDMLKGLELSPASAYGMARYADVLQYSGHPAEAVRAARRSVELDPNSLRTREMLVRNFYFARDYEGAIAEAKKTLQLEPDAAIAYFFMAWSEMMPGNYDAARIAAGKAIAINPGDPYLEIVPTTIMAMAGQKDEARVSLAEADRKGWPLPEIAIAYAHLGGFDQAFAYLERALAESPINLYYIHADPSFAPLHADARWKDLMARLDTGE